MTPVTERPEETGQLPPPEPGTTPVGPTGLEPPPVEPPPVQPPPAEPPTFDSSAGSAPRRRSGWHIAAIVVGALMLLPAFGTAAAGTALVIAQGAATDDGFFDVTIDRIESDGVAIAAVDLWDTADDPDAPWALDWFDVDVRLEVAGALDTTDVFVGIARSADVEAYLADSAYSEITDFDDRVPRYLERAGDGSVEAPVDVDIWDVSAAGAGDQTVTWEARNGDWAVVVMNADGSPTVAADVEVGLRSDAIMPIGIVMIVIGSLGLIIGTVLIVVGARGRRV